MRFWGFFGHFSDYGDILVILRLRGYFGHFLDFDCFFLGLRSNLVILDLLGAFCSSKVILAFFSVEAIFNQFVITII